MKIEKKKKLRAGTLFSDDLELFAAAAVTRTRAAHRPPVTLRPTDRSSAIPGIEYGTEIAR